MGWAKARPEPNPGLGSVAEADGNRTRQAAFAPSTVLKTVRGVLRKSGTSWGICRKLLWHSGLRPFIIFGHLPVICIVFRSPAPPARPEMRKTAHRDPEHPAKCALLLLIWCSRMGRLTERHGAEGKVFMRQRRSAREVRCGDALLPGQDLVGHLFLEPRQPRCCWIACRDLDAATDNGACIYSPTLPNSASPSAESISRYSPSSKRSSMGRASTSGASSVETPGRGRPDVVALALAKPSVVTSTA